MMKRVVALIFALVILASTATVQCKADLYSPDFVVIGTVWGTPSNPIEVGPGDRNVPLTVMLEYLPYEHGKTTATSINFTLILPEGFTDVDGFRTASAYMVGVAPNSIFYLNFNLNVDSSLAVANYTIPMAITWNSTSYTNLEQSTEVTVQLKGKVKLTFETAQTHLNPRDVNNVEVILSNTGSGDAYEVSTTISAPSQVSILSKPPTISTLKASSIFKLNMSVYVAPAAEGLPLTFSLTTTYKDAYFNARSISQTLGFIVKEIGPSMSPIALAVQPTTLTTGKLNDLNITVSNIGDSSIRKLSVSFAFSGGQITWLQPDLVQSETLLPGQSITIHAEVYAPPTVAASTVLQISLKYYDTNNILNQEIRSVGLLSKGIIDIELVDFSVIPEQPSPGQVFSITATLTNIGTITASAVTVVPRPPEGFTIFGSRSIFIGDMPLNAPTTFTLSLFAANTTKPSAYEVPVDLTYLDNLRNPISATINLSVVVKEPSTLTPGSQQMPFWASLDSFALFLIIAVAAIMLAAGFLLGRRIGKK